MIYGKILLISFDRVFFLALHQLAILVQHITYNSIASCSIICYNFAEDTKRKKKHFQVSQNKCIKNQDFIYFIDRIDCFWSYSISTTKSTKKNNTVQRSNSIQLDRNDSFNCRSVYPKSSSHTSHRSSAFVLSQYFYASQAFRDRT